MAKCLGTFALGAATLKYTQPVSGDRATAETAFRSVNNLLLHTAIKMRCTQLVHAFSVRITSLSLPQCGTALLSQERDEKEKSSEKKDLPLKARVSKTQNVLFVEPYAYIMTPAEEYRVAVKTVIDYGIIKYRMCTYVLRMHIQGQVGFIH